jgi:HEAT repeat protein
VGIHVLDSAAIAALGEVGDLRCVDQILRFAQSDDWLTRQRLAESLGHLNCEKSLSALNYLVKDAHPQVAAAARYAIERLVAS